MNGAMLHWMCKVKAEDDVSLHELYSRLYSQPTESMLRINCLRWYGHVERSEKWIKCCTQIDISGCQGRGRPCTSWKESVTDDLCLWSISPNMVNYRSKWKYTKESHEKLNPRKLWKSGSIRVSKY